MKLFQSCLIFLASGAASAFPTSHSDIDTSLIQDLDIRSVNEPNLALQTLERRIDPRTCRVVGQTILRIGTSAATAAFVNGAAKLAQKVCNDQGSPKCAQIVGYIQDGLNLIFIYQGFAHGAVAEGGHGEQGSQEPGSVKRSSATDWTTILQDGGYSFDAIEHVDVTALNSKRDEENDKTDDPFLTHRSIVRNLTCTNSSSPADIAFNHYSNGDMDLVHPGDLGTLPSTHSPTTLAKRYDGSGFKISWTSRLRSRLTRAHQNDMSRAIARDWAARADATDEGDYMGLVKTDHTANFYFRIIPETKGFGLNYESVNVCGGMAGFL